MDQDEIKAAAAELTRRRRARTDATKADADPVPKTDERRAAARELAAYERERAERIRRRNRVSVKVVGIFTIAALALLGYDSADAAVNAHRDGRSWVYPGIVAALCVACVLGLGIYALRRRR